MKNIKITVERNSGKNKMTASACCDSETFLEGVCGEDICSYDEERTICCVLCELLFDCTRPCSKIEMRSGE
ncbi:hypothetical protein MTAT_26710 [Moorella thermoacetica]|uniref:Uncharacterized protein n=2 Tax=Neomoorella thermoacetica TaxID=1525 RepID=A0AAC9HFX1_NEOTH|nr:hypothetical protein Maut_00563 [Moorella thermoacetica]TYL09003.1 hypothetical protein MTAT_26710 [Moorella thermoacetica]